MVFVERGGMVVVVVGMKKAVDVAGVVVGIMRVVVVDGITPEGRGVDTDAVIGLVETVDTNAVIGLVEKEVIPKVGCEDAAGDCCRSICCINSEIWLEMESK